MVGKAPAFAAIAILSLAIGIGANSAIFSVTNALILRPLPYPQADRIAMVWQRSPGLNVPRDWLSIVKSPRARTKIRQWFSRERREDALETGKDLLQRALRKQSLPVVRLTSDAFMHQVASDLKYPDLDLLYVAIGEGHVSPQSVVSRLIRLVSDEAEEEAEEIPAVRPVRIPRRDTSGVMVQGRSDVWVKLSKCCTPVPV